MRFLLSMLAQEDRHAPTVSTPVASLDQQATQAFNVGLTICQGFRRLISQVEIMRVGRRRTNDENGIAPLACLQRDRLFS